MTVVALLLLAIVAAFGYLIYTQLKRIADQGEPQPPRPVQPQPSAQQTPPLQPPAWDQQNYYVPPQPNWQRPGV